MASDPRVHKPRLPKVYTDQQLAFLKSNLAEFERRSQGSIRGDAKKFALERASEFIARFGLPDEFIGIEEAEPRFREQIYNWFKNTVGRTRRKLEGRPRSAKKSTEKVAQSNALGWNANVPPPAVIPYPTVDTTATTASQLVAPETVAAPLSFGNLQATAAPMGSASIHTPTIGHTPSASHSHALGMPITQSTIQDAFIRGLDATNLASMIQTFSLSNPSLTPLAPVIDALYDSIFSDSNSLHRDPIPYLRRYLDASNLFTHTVVHAGVSGPHAGLQALEMQIRRHSMWVPNVYPRLSLTSPVSSNSSLTDEMQRIACDRQRRKDHVQWARIHAAALELGVLRMPSISEPDRTFASGRLFSDIIAKDSVWGNDEVEWVAGICILRAIIRTTTGATRQQRDEYEELLRRYEDRWKEIKDETRQALVTEVLLAAKEDLTRWDDIPR
ncbi:hypothetical protein AMATHDRAFT_60762 [Amanita thiersii Skay4041]|uniref:Uncharacterized protein n=1 Tax=Amanita thiersii Skay4041 TaxID=703135 RepID=A0A2A9NS81_9AGAR|nr:hypothetical protein AMATHDRAFT_60762 [Amanita thiersii Skay4041]